LSSKKELENKYLKEIVNIYPDFPIGIVMESESPDFLLNFQSKIIGIELTRYSRKQRGLNVNNREIEKTGNKILKIAQAKFESKHNIFLQVSASWNIQKKLTYREIELFSNTFVDIVENNIPSGIHEHLFIDNHDLWTTPLADCCNFFSITRNMTESLWASNEGGFITVVGQEIQELISLKNKKVAKYKQKCEEIWLIIVCEGKNISSMVDLRDVNNWRFHSPFDKVLLYDRERSTVHSISISKTPP